MKENQLPSSDANLFSEMEEGHYFDRKSARKDPTEIARHIIAFTNAAGGKLIIGIEDNGEITGFKRNGAHDIELFEQLPITLCVPTPVVFAKRIKTRNSNGEDDIILVLEIEASSDHVVARSTDGMVFLRQGDKTVKLNYDQIRALEYDRNERIFEDELIRDSSINDIDQEEIQAYKKLLGTDITTEQLLKSRNFMRNNQLTIAGVVLFAKTQRGFCLPLVFAS